MLFWPCWWLVRVTLVVAFGVCPKILGGGRNLWMIFLLLHVYECNLSVVDNQSWWRCKCFIRPVARVGSGDPVRVLRLYTTITLDEVCSIYCWGICTTCHYRSMCYSTCASGPTVLSMCCRLRLVANCSTKNWALILYCMMPFIATCVDAIGTVFWDRPALR